MSLNNEETMRLEALGDLRRCLELAESIDDLQLVEGADPDLEIGALYELSLEEEAPKVLVFDKIKGLHASRCVQSQHNINPHR